MCATSTISEPAAVDQGGAVVHQLRAGRRCLLRQEGRHRRERRRGHHADIARRRRRCRAAPTTRSAATRRRRTRHHPRRRPRRRAETPPGDHRRDHEPTETTAEERSAPDVVVQRRCRPRGRPRGRRPARRRRRGRDRFAVDAVGDAVRLVLPDALPHVLRPADGRHQNLEIEGFLAESIEPNDDFTVWTITLRDGIKFHDGTPLDADAVIYNLNEATNSLLLLSGAPAATTADARRPPRWRREARPSQLHDRHRQERRHQHARFVAAAPVLPVRPARPDRLAEVARGCQGRCRRGHPPRWARDRSSSPSTRPATG